MNRTPAMNTAQLHRILVEAGFRPGSYSLDGGDQNDTLCIQALSGGRLVVYYTERGSRFDTHKFDDESAACEYFLQTMRNTHGNRINRM